MTDVQTAPAADGNARPYSVSELAFALKRTLEDAYGFVRLRGEISKVTRHGNGHIYLDLKDENACIAGVVWKGSVRGLKAQPEQGLEVIVTGKITTFAPRSSYQLIIETMEHAGVGALLAQLERLKAQLRTEGLFEPARKKPLPAMPRVVGVVTSPTGAVIRDILHRIRDRWPVHVIVWPVVVQGPDAAAQVGAAIRGFNAIEPGAALPRPDVLIVARGGGSVEDLWPFNDEALARTAAASRIPLISAVGHETDTTLIDFVSDRRAPTPTAAAEIATPVLADLKGAILEFERRMGRCTQHALETRRARLMAARLPRPVDLLGPAGQRFDLAAGRLGAALARNVGVHETELARTLGRFSPALLARPQKVKADRLAELSSRLDAALSRNVGVHQAQLGRTLGRFSPTLLQRPQALNTGKLEALAARLDAAAVRTAELATRRARLPELSQRMGQSLAQRIARDAERLQRIEQLRLSLNPDRPLNLGFARVHRADGHLVRKGAELQVGEPIRLVFADRERHAVVDGAAKPAVAKPAAAPKPPAGGGQGSLF